MKHITVFAALAALSVSAYSAPSISIGALYEYLEPGKSTLLKRVRNGGDSTAFVKVSVNEIVYEGDAPPTEKPVQPVVHGKGHQANTLVASPARLIVPAGGMQATRLLAMGERDKERYFRVRFSPVMPEQGDDFGVSAEQAEQYKESLSAGFNILAGYGAVMVVRPAKVHYQTELQDGATTYTVHNKGNSIIVLDGFRDCKTVGSECATPTISHVLPQRSRVFEKEAGHHYRFELVEGDRKRAVEFGK
ncbi:pilus assembly protein [Herbaspirillum rhizosphaerae]|uniref:pilus assembly protein n=1 Tax=Herbaspirillum rhizosphaerae TaxID=346179 RepID=UPI00067AD58A|nr:pilus assembly protein [Herbaspirillum rhizosphaerae]